MSSQIPEVAGERLGTTAIDRQRMSALAAYAARTLRTPHPRPIAAEIVHTRSGRTLVRALNAVRELRDPSAHAEVQAIRLAARRLKRLALEGYTLYATCEPCPMCMSAALWAGLDRVVFGATMDDARRHCRQICVPAAEIAARSDMPCVVDGPVLREECYALFTHPRMVRAFRLFPARSCGN